MILLGDQLGSVGDPDSQFMSHFSDSGKRAKDIVGAYLLACAALAFLLFLAGLSAFLRTESDRIAAVAQVSMISGLAFVAALLVGAASLSAVSSSVAYADLFGEPSHQFGADVTRLATQLGFMLLVFGMLAAALSIAAICASALQTSIFPGWLAWLGIAAAAVLLFGFFFIPIFALPVWVLAVSLSLLRRPKWGRTPGLLTPCPIAPTISP